MTKRVSPEISCLRLLFHYNHFSSFLHFVMQCIILHQSSHAAQLLPSLQVSDEHTFIVDASRVPTSSYYSVNYRGIVQSLDTRSIA